MPAGAKARSIKDGLAARLKVVPSRVVPSRVGTNWVQNERRLTPNGHLRLICHFVVARLAAGRTIIKAVLAEADIDLRLAEAAVLLAFAALFGHLALHAAVLDFGSGCLCVHMGEM